MVFLTSYRSRLQIIRDVLLVASSENGARKTHIMYGAFLSYSLLVRYLAVVSNAGLIESDGGSYYKITEKGKMFLRLYEDYEQKRTKLIERVNTVENGRLVLEEMLR